MTTHYSTVGTHQSAATLAVQARCIGEDLHLKERYVTQLNIIENNVTGMKHLSHYFTT